MKFLRELTKEDLVGKKCLLRINLDIQDTEKDSSRIDGSLPTIQFLLDNGAKPIILSHRGRPTFAEAASFAEVATKAESSGKSDFLLKPLVEILEKKVGKKIDYLENLRFDPREQKNDEGFARELAGKGDLYVNDDFATSHRKCASMVAIVKFIPAYAGLLLEKEIKNLSKVMENPEKPLVIIIGGVKIEDKIGVLANFQNKADYFLLGSAYSEIQNQKPIIRNFKNVIFPEDFVLEGDKKFDIGPETIEKYSEIIGRTKTVIWNGPLGMAENPAYANGSEKIARAIIDASRRIGTFSVVGGGDTDQFLNQLGLRNKFSFVSTGGGAMLAFLAGEKLPAIKALL